MTTLKIGRYEVREQIGRGASGSIYLAYDALLERTVALKTYAEGVGISGDAGQNFLREVKAASKLVHPNVVITYDGGIDEGVAFLAMELVEGVSLAKWLADRGRPTPAETLDLLRAVASGLAHAHAHGIVHRDLKPANILIPTRGGLADAKITDFGIAKVIGTERTRTTGLGPGTPTSMAPEQIQGKDVDTRADVFALGILAYQLLTGSRPFQGEEVVAIFYAILNADPVPPSRVDPSLPKALDAPIARALAKDPDRRTPDVRTLVEEIAEALRQPDARRGIAGGWWWAAVPVALLGIFLYQVWNVRSSRDSNEPHPPGPAVRLAAPTPPAASMPTEAPEPTPIPEPTEIPTPAEAPTAAVPATVEPEAPRVRVPAPPAAAAPIPKPPRRPPPTPRRPVPRAATGTATLIVSSTPPGARVAIDGVPRGTTPLELGGLQPKTVTITAEFPTLAPASRTVRLLAGGTHTVEFSIR